MDEETRWNMAQRFVRLPLVLSMVGAWDFWWWLRQCEIVSPHHHTLWNIDAVGTEIFADEFIDPVRRSGGAWFDA